MPILPYSFRNGEKKRPDLITPLPVRINADSHTTFLSEFPDQEILNDLERERILVFTPSRLVGGKRTVCYDDRYVLRLAVEIDGIVVSNDNYRDLAAENPDFKRVIEERTLMYSFVNDR